jgi:hypothetical protein
MINFGELELKTNEKYSFVGIENKNGQLLFHLPKGFSPEDIRALNTFDQKRDLFFLFYRVLNVFKQTSLEKGNFEEDAKADERDGVVKEDAGGEISYNNNGEIIFYSKVDALTSILDAYDELKILTFVHRLGKSETLDYSKLHRYLHKGIFLDNGAIYIDSMDVLRKEIHFESSDIVSMYCYILTEIKEQLKEEVRSEVQSLAEQFRQQYIGTESSLFSEKSYQPILNCLKDALEVIDNYTPLKDPDYWHFYDAIEAFLFGELEHSAEGEIWGINNFHSVWEAMCLTYLVKNTEPGFLVYLDERLVSSQIINKFKSAHKIIDLSEVFRVNGAEVFPDAVIITSKKMPLSPAWDLSLGSYKIKADSWNLPWNDYGYKTRFTLVLPSGNRDIKIGYPDQPVGVHTFYKLKNQLASNGGTRTVDSSLPEEFYSFWDPDNLTIEELRMMRCLNHVFYRAWKKGVCSKEEFSKWIQSIKSKVFEKSLFRKDTEQRSISEIAELFLFFLIKLTSRFQIVDIKYSSPEYYLNPQNAEEIKRRSVRKQFLYEYLLQKHLRDSNSPLKDWDITSEFWLPVYSPDSPAFSPGPQYLDGYLNLTQVNIMSVIDSYLETKSP